MHQLWFSHFSTVVFQRNGKYSKLLTVNLWDVWHLKSWALTRKKFPLAVCGLQNFFMKGTKKDVRSRREHICDQEKLFLWNTGFSCDRTETRLDMLMHYYRKMKLCNGRTAMFEELYLFTDLNQCRLATYTYIHHMYMYFTAFSQRITTTWTCSIRF